MLEEQIAALKRERDAARDAERRIGRMARRIYGR